MTEGLAQKAKTENLSKSLKDKPKPRHRNAKDSGASEGDMKIAGTQGRILHM